MDQDASNSSAENLVFLCLEHHDKYDSTTSQSKGLTQVEVRRYRDQLARYVLKTFPPSDTDIARTLLATLDRPAFRTPFHQESSLPRFRTAIAETIAAINTGKTADGRRVPSKKDLRDTGLRMKIEAVVVALAALRAAFDQLVKSKEIRHCGCQEAECPIYMLSDRAAHEMDRRRQDLLARAHQVDPEFSPHFYDLA